MFKDTVPGSIDCMPIYVQRPESYVQQAALYNGKYKTHVVKVGSIDVWRCACVVSDDGCVGAMRGEQHGRTVVV